MAQVKLEKVWRDFPGGVRAVDHIDLAIADEEFVVLVGPSGCGKTTTLRMIAGLEPLSGGVIRIGENVVNDVPPKDRNIAMVFQNYALYPHMTVFQNLAFGLKLRRTPKAEIIRRVAEAAEMLELKGLLDRKPAKLSGGQRQRVALGRAIVREPAAFLFDEPLSNLDAQLRVSTRAQLKRLHQRLRTTSIYVTHDQEEAMSLGDRIVVMKDGRIQQADTPLATYNHPVNRFVAGFIGMPPMNFFDGAIKSVAGQLVFQEGRLAGRADGEGGQQLTMPPGGFTLAVPPAIGERLEGRVGERVVLGIRPEHLTARLPESADRASGWSPVIMRVNVVEPLGKDMDVFFSTQLTEQVVARMPSDVQLQAGEETTAFVDSSKAHFFEPGATGMNLNRTNEPAHALI
jgi:multiple sugar transport system ATP-binding protein